MIRARVDDQTYGAVAAAPPYHLLTGRCRCVGVEFTNEDQGRRGSRSHRGIAPGIMDNGGPETAIERCLDTAKDRRRNRRIASTPSLANETWPTLNFALHSSSTAVSTAEPIVFSV